MPSSNSSNSSSSSSSSRFVYLHLRFSYKNQTSFFLLDFADKAKHLPLPATAYAGVGLSVTLACPAVATPPVMRVTWFKNGNRIETHQVCIGSVDACACVCVRVYVTLARVIRCKPILPLLQVKHLRFPPCNR